MLSTIIKVVTDITLTAADLKSLELNNTESRSAKDRQRRQEQRKMVSNVRNVSYLLRRISR